MGKLYFAIPSKTVNSLEGAQQKYWSFEGLPVKTIAFF